MLSVDRERQSFTNQRVVERSLLAVEADIVGAHDRFDMEFVIAFKGRDLFGRNVLDQLDLTVLISCVSSVCILDQMPDNLIKCNLVCFPVVRVLFEDDLVTVRELGHVVRAAGHIGLRLRPPAVAVRLDGCLLNRNHDCESADLVEVGAGSLQLDNKRLVIRSGDSELVKVAFRRFFITDDVVEKVVAVGSRNSRIRHSLPGVDKVIGCKIRAVRPLEAVS